MAAESTTYRLSDEINPEEGLAHDQVVLAARAIAGTLGIHLGHFDHKFERSRMYVELEYEITDKDFVDIAVFYDNTLQFLMEIKSKRETQSASAWTRQVKRYIKRAQRPCCLVIAHELGATQQKYLEVAAVRVVDLREIIPTLRAVK